MSLPIKEGNCGLIVAGVWKINIPFSLLWEKWATSVGLNRVGWSSETLWIQSSHAASRFKSEHFNMPSFPLTSSDIMWTCHAQKDTITHRQCCDWAACISIRTTFVSTQPAMSNEQLRFVQDNRMGLISTQPTWAMSWTIEHFPSNARLIWPSKEAICHVPMGNWLHTFVQLILHLFWESRTPASLEQLKVMDQGWHRVS